MASFVTFETPLPQRPQQAREPSYVQSGVDGIIGEFTVSPDGTLTQFGVVNIPGGGSEGISAT